MPPAWTKPPSRSSAPSPLKPQLDAIAAMKSKKDLAPLLAKQQLENRTDGLLFNFGSNQDFENSNEIIAFADSGGLGLPDRDYYLKTDPKSVEQRDKYVTHVTNMFELLGDSPATAKAEAAKVLAIETDLAKATLTLVDKRDPYKLFHKMDRAKLQALTPSFDWNTFLTVQGLPNVQTFNVTEPEFYKQVEKEINTVSLDDWKTYLRWHIAHANAPYLSSKFVNENFAFYGKTLRGAEQLRPRWKRCVSLVDEQLGEALGQEFVRRAFTPEMKASTVQMTQYIEDAMKQDIEQLTWMSPETKKNALEKLHTIVNKVGYPDKWRDYSSVEIKRDDFLGNETRATVFESDRQLAKIGKPVDRAEWGMTPPTVNAYYNPQMNDINFPAGVLQPPLYDPKMDDAPNYGNTGSTIGHELTHGFDDQGRQFDAQGNLKDWWTKQDADEFTKRAQCVVDQYGQVHGCRRSEDQQQADAGRRHRRPRRHHPRLRCMEGRDEESAAARHRGIHSGPALLHRTGAVGLRESASGKPAFAHADRSAFARKVPDQRRGREHAGVPEGVLVQSGTANGERKSLPGMVSLEYGIPG